MVWRTLDVTAVLYKDALEGDNCHLQGSTGCWPGQILARPNFLNLAWLCAMVDGFLRPPLSAVAAVYMASAASAAISVVVCLCSRIHN